MGVPKCARCNRNDYGGEIKVDVRLFGLSGSETYSLCGFCLPIVHGKLAGFIQDHVVVEPAVESRSDKGIINVFDRGAV